MTFAPEIDARIRAYLDEVRRNIADRPEAVRADLLRQLESHICEALRSRGGDQPGVSDLDAVLSEMDPPEMYRAEERTTEQAPSSIPTGRFAAADTAGGAPETQPPRAGKWRDPRGRWFLLALCFLALNGWAVWRLTSTRSDEPDEVSDPPPVSAAETNTPPRQEHLQLLSLSQAAYDASTETVTLRLVFNAPPKPTQLANYLSLGLDNTTPPQPVSWDLAGTVLSNDVLIRSTQRIQQGQRIVVRVAKGLPSASGSTSTPVDQQLSLVVNNVLQIGALDPQSPTFEACWLMVTFGRPIDLTDIANFVSVQPPVKFDATCYYSGTYRLTGDFEPGKTYAVTFRKGLRTTDGVVLSADVTRSAFFPNRAPAIALASDGRYLSPRGALQVPVLAVNVRKCLVSLRQLVPDNVVFYANREDSYFARNLLPNLTAPASTNWVTLADATNREQKFYVNLRDLAGPEPLGVFELSVDDPETHPENRHRYYGWRNRAQHLIVVTDLGISAKISREGVLAWITSLRTGQPAPDAEVVLRANNNQELSRGRTDANGLVFLACKRGAPQELVPSLITAAQGRDLSFVRLTGGTVSVENSGGASYLADGYEAFLFADRGIYRPGETLHAQALVRDAHLAPPDPFPVLLRVRKPDGRVFRDFAATLSTNGAAAWHVELPSYLPTGRFDLQVVMPGTGKELGKTCFSVEEFVPPQIAVSLSNLPTRVSATNTFQAQVSARHLFGRPAAGLPASAGVYLEDASFHPTNWSGFVFGDPEKAAFHKDLKLGDTLLDDEGRVCFTVPAVGPVRSIGPIRATFTATVRDSGGRAVSASASTRIDAYPFYIGLKSVRENGAVRVGITQSFTVVTVLPDGMVVQPDAPLLATVERAEWSTAMKFVNGHYSWESQRLKTRVGEPLKIALRDGRGEVPFTADRAGEYIVTVTDPFTGASSSLTLYAAAKDNDWISWSRNKPTQVQLAFDRSDYAPGQKARLSIRAPFSGVALLTVESDRVLDRRVITLAGNTAECEIDVKPEYAPNVHCVLSLIRPAVAESVWTAHRAVGSAVLKVVPPGHRLTVEVGSPKVIRPCGKLAVNVHVADEAGDGVDQAELVVMAVDEGICLLTALPTPDPLAYFQRTRGLEVSLVDLYGDLMPVCEDTADATVSHTGGGGDDVEGQIARRMNPIRATRFRPVALWQGGARTDADGNATVTFDVPEFTGELRISTVAFTRRAFGSARKPVTIKRPLVVQAELPRFLAPGDTCRMLLAVSNETGADQQAAWRVTCGGPLQAATVEGALPLKAGGSGRIPVVLHAGAVPGKALCAVEVTAGGERYSETIEIAVRPVSAPVSRFVSAAIPPGGEARIPTPADWLPETAFFETWISRQPDVRLTGSLDWLIRYPYGCCEQTTSSAFPLLYLADLVTRTQPQSMGRLDTSQYVLSGIYRLLTMQRESGGFAMWPDSRHEEPWISTYATHFLVEARRAGFAVPTDRLDAALAYLRDCLERRDGESGQTAPGFDFAQRAYFCEVLALAGKPEEGWTARLLDRAAEGSCAGRAHLAAALLASGKPREAVRILEGLGVPKPASNATGYDSRTRDVALVLSAWMDVDPNRDSVLKLVRELDALRVPNESWWGTTQENALALLALGKFARLTKPDLTPFAGELLPAGTNAVAFASDRELHWRSQIPGSTRELRIVNRGPGACWYGARIEGVPPATLEKPVDAGLAVRREFLDSAGNPIDPHKRRQGDLIIVKLTLDAKESVQNNLLVVDLLPAGWEVENPALATAANLPWLKTKTDWCTHRELRDDRVLLFTGTVWGRIEYYYTVRAVTPGAYILPPVRAESMYHPEVYSVSGTEQVQVIE